VLVEAISVVSGAVVAVGEARRRLLVGVD